MNEKQLVELIIYVQEMREEGNTDLRQIIYVLNQLKIDKDYVINDN